MKSLDLATLDLSDPLVFASTTAVFFAMVMFRYVLVVGAFFGVCWLWRPTCTERRQIYRTLPGMKQWRQEFFWSVMTSLQFAVIGVVTLWLWQRGHTAIYTDWAAYGTTYAILSMVIYSLIHETYFYWMHRAIHHPKLFHRLHRIHHLSVRPSPWAAFSFNPSEAFLEALIVPILLLMIPMHPIVLIAYLSLMTLSSVINHLGFELYPKGTATNPIGKWFIGATHHSQHHRFSHCNFGLYFTFWDHLCGTQHSGYVDNFAKVTSSMIATPRSQQPPDSRRSTTTPRMQS